MSSECLFIFGGDSPVLAVVYMDEILFIGKHESETNVMKILKIILTVTDLGPYQYFLGMSKVRKLNGVFIAQKTYTERLINASGMNTYNSTWTALPWNQTSY